MMKRRTSATVPVNQDDEKTSPKTDSKTTSSTPIIQRRVALFDARQPPYEHPIDLRLGLHFNGDSHACSRICRSDATSTSLDERFRKMRDDPGRSPIGAWCSLEMMTYTVGLPLQMNALVLRVGIEDPENWIMVHDKVVKFRDECFWDVFVPIRYYELEADDDF
ncbi:hypothetical protein D6D18_09931 [Aureobasidium pullulans]|nr:hypothetical protein D6D18_09931 [Aureobasidium pullulans]